jgi:hypothetical protein
MFSNTAGYLARHESPEPASVPSASQEGVLLSAQMSRVPEEVRGFHGGF